MTKKPWYHKHKFKICQAWLDCAKAHGATHLVTFIFNRNGNCSIASAEHAIDDWHMRVDKALYGQNYNKMSRDKRTSFIAFVEHQETNLHFHAVLKTPRTKQFALVAKLKWKELVQSGQFSVDNDAVTQNDLDLWSDYITKELMKGTNIDHVIMSIAHDHKRKASKEGK